MPIPEEGVDQYLNELIDATQKGLVRWKAVNPTTFFWDAVSDGKRTGRISLQKVQRNIVPRIPGPRPSGIAIGSPGVHTSYIFQAIDFNQAPNTPRISIDTYNQTQLNSKLEALFNLAGEGISKQDLDFLKGLLPQSKT